MSIIINKEMPKDCMSCPIRLECDAYKSGLKFVTDKIPEPFCDGCLIVPGLPITFTKDGNYYVSVIDGKPYISKV